MMWSSDYPHTDSPWPHSQEYIEGAAFKRITPEETQKIVADNAARLLDHATCRAREEASPELTMPPSA